MDEQRTHEFRKARRAACRAERDPADPVAFEFEHEETGEVKFIEAIQVEIGFQEENPRWQLIGPVYPQAPVVAGNPSDQMREALRMYMSAGSGNSTDFDLQAKAWSMAHEALNHTPDTGKMVDHVDDANKMVRLTDDEVTEIYMRFCGYRGLSPRLFEDVAGCVMAAMIKKNGGQS
jgi:hypothetical protein